MIFALASFLHNGQRIRDDLIDAMIEKLREVRDIVKQVIPTTFSSLSFFMPHFHFLMSSQHGDFGPRVCFLYMMLWDHVWKSTSLTSRTVTFTEITRPPMRYDIAFARGI